MHEPVYEMLLLLPQSLEEQQKDQVLTQVKRYVEEKGTLHQLKHWKDLRLAYPIKHEEEGSYYLLYFQIPPPTVADLTYRVRNVEGVLRLMVTRIDEVYRKAKLPLPYLAEEASGEENGSG